MGKELLSVEHTLESTLVQERISLEEVTQILSSPIAIEENRKKIQDFKIGYKVLQEQIQDLESKFVHVSLILKPLLNLKTIHTQGTGSKSASRAVHKNRQRTGTYH